MKTRSDSMDSNLTGYESSATNCSSSSYDKMTRRVHDLSRACVILADNESEDGDVVEILRKLGLAVQFRTASQVEMLKNDNGCIIVQDFASFLDKRDPSLLYYGPTCIKRVGSEMADKDDQKPELPFTGHSMLTTLLFGTKCCLQVPKSVQLKNRAQVYALGGRLARKVHEANLLIMTSASGEQYKLAQNFRIPVVATGFLDALWERRNSLEFKVTPEFIEHFRLPVFSRLKINFFGFEPDKLQELKERTEANNGIHVETVSRDHTFIVVVNRDTCSIEDLQRLDQELSLESSIVYEEWFHESIKDGYALCAKQEKFDARRLAALQNSACSPLGRRKRAAESPGTTPRSKKSMEALLSPRIGELSRLDSCSGVFSPAAGAASPIPKDLITDKRHLVLNELRDTEANYLKVLHLIMNKAIQHLGFDKRNTKQTSGASKDEILTRFERQEIFKELPNIISLHENLLKKIDIAMNTTDFRYVSTIFIGEDACGMLPDVENDSKSKRRLSRKAAEREAKNNIVATYKTFLNGLETIKARVEALIAENPRFADFVRNVEEQPECNREKFIHLLIRPVQRWPSILNLLKRYMEECDKLAKRLEDRMSAGNEAAVRNEVLLVKQGSQDAARVHKFIEDSLRQMNDSKSLTLMITEALKTQGLIEDYPAMPWSNNFTLVHQCDSLLVSASETLMHGQKFTSKNIDCVCFIFSHGVEIAKKKVGKHSKPYKHIAFINFEKINTLIINDGADLNLRRYIEIVFREPRKEPCVSGSTVKYGRIESTSSLAEADEDTISLNSVAEATTEYTEERVLLDLKDASGKDSMLKHMQTACKGGLDVESIMITAAVADKKDALRSDSLLLNFSSAHGTPVAQLARSLSNVSEITTPKKLTRTLSNLIKHKMFGQKRDETSSPHSPPSNSTGTLSRSRHAARCVSAPSSGFLSLSPLSRKMDNLVLKSFSVITSKTQTNAREDVSSLVMKTNRDRVKSVLPPTTDKSTREPSKNTGRKKPLLRV